MKMSEVFPSKWLTAADLDEQDVTMTIDQVRMEDMTEDGDPKAVCYFNEVKKGLVLNKTNSTTIVALYGNDTDDWEGQRITLYPTEVNFQGKMTPCIRVRSKLPRSSKAKPEKVALPTSDNDDDVPY